VLLIGAILWVFAIRDGGIQLLDLPTGSTVSVDGVSVGTVRDGKPFAVSNLAPGMHWVRVEMPNGRVVEQPVKVQSSRTAPVAPHPVSSATVPDLSHQTDSPLTPTPTGDSRTGEPAPAEVETQPNAAAPAHNESASAWQQEDCVMGVDPRLQPGCVNESSGVFVAPELFVNMRGGPSRSDGTRRYPLNSIEKALFVAQVTHKRRVYICSFANYIIQEDIALYDGDTYVEPCAQGAWRNAIEHVPRPSGVTIHGGFDCMQWQPAQARPKLCAPPGRSDAGQ
jgi:hypothetical protein